MKRHFLFLVFCFSQLIFSQSVDTLFSDFSEFLTTGKDIITAPGSFDQKDIIKTGGVVLVTAASFFADKEVKSFSFRNNNSFNKHLFNIDKYFYLESSIALTAGTYFYGFFAEDPEIRRLGIDLGEAAFYSGIINVFIKYASGRHRPLNTDDNIDFSPFNLSTAHSSFGSGHTTLAFAVSTVMAGQSDNFFWKAAWFTAAGLVGAARIYHNMHWFSDVILGGSIGYFIGEYVSGDKENAELTVVPYGISLRISL